MDGLCEVLGAKTSLSVGGKQYTLSPLRLSDYAELEARLVSSRPDPLTAVKPHLEGLSELLQKHLLACAYDDARRGRCVTADELARWLESVEGKVYWLWLSLRRQHPELTLEAAELLLHKAGVENRGRAPPARPVEEPERGNVHGQV